MKYVTLTILVPANDPLLDIQGSVDEWYEPVEYWGGKSHQHMVEVNVDECTFGNYEVTDYSIDEAQDILLERYEDARYDVDI